MASPLGEETAGPVGRPLAAIGAAGLLAGLLSFGLGEAIYGFFEPEEVSQPLGGAKVLRPTLETVATADARNSALTFGLMGGVLGLTFGVAGGLSRHSIRATAGAGLLGLSLGAILGVVLSLVLVTQFRRMQHWRDSDDLLTPIGLHAGLWGPLGAVAGLAFGVGRGRRGTALPHMIGGLIGAVLAVIAYDILGAAVTPLAGTSDAISTTWPTRLLARMLVALGTAAGIAMTARVPAALSVAPDAPRPDPLPVGDR